MTKQNHPERRLVFSLQPGGVGKSTTLSGLISYLNFSGVDFDACDSDTQHHTLTNRNRDVIHKKPFDATKDLDAFHTLIAGISDAPVTLVDFPAQSRDFVLDAFTHFNVLDGFEQEGIRPTVLVFATNDLKCAAVAAEAVRYFQGHADYILVENPACFHSDTFKATPLYKSMVDKGTPTLRLTTIDQKSLREWEALERTTKAYISLDDACATDHLYWLTRYALSGFRNSLLRQFEDMAVPRLVPDASLIQNRVTRVEPLSMVPVSALDDPML